MKSLFCARAIYELGRTFHSGSEVHTPEHKKRQISSLTDCFKEALDHSPKSSAQWLQIQFSSRVIMGKEFWGGLNEMKLHLFSKVSL